MRPRPAGSILTLHRAQGPRDPIRSRLYDDAEREQPHELQMRVMPQLELQHRQTGEKRPDMPGDDITGPVTLRVVQARQPDE